MEFFKALWNDLTALTGDTVTLGTNTITTLNIIVWSLFIGFILAIFATLYNKFVIGKVVRTLLKKEIHSEENALTAAELECDNPFVRFALRKNASLRRIVYLSGDTDAEQQKYDRSSSKLYIPEGKIHRAEVTYGTKDITAGTVILSIVACIVVAILALIFIPELVTMLSNFIAGITPKDNIY
ncbi:MAG: hypothetical protein IJY93_06965 [Clostridia bacterium]|nr:hypothetical protein [Clostridia bacterium]